MKSSALIPTTRQLQENTVKMNYRSEREHDCSRYYTQGVDVLYEIDFGLLKELNDMKKVTSNLTETLNVLFLALGN